MEQDADAPPSAKRTRKLDLVNDPQWARLVGVFNLSSPKDLSSLSLEVLRNKAFELQLADMNITKKPKKPTSFNSYLAACEAIIGSLPTASTTQQQPANMEQPANDDGDATSSAEAAPEVEMAEAGATIADADI